MASSESAPPRPSPHPALAAANRRAGAAARRVPVALAVVLAGALLIRIAIALVYRPTVMTNEDTPVYIDMASGDLFSDPSRTMGYSLFLRAVHAISSQVEVTIAVQHLLGLATGLLLFATVRRLGAPLWVAVVSAAAVLLSVDQIVLEHTVISESLFTVLLAGVLYCAVRALDAPRAWFGRVTTRHAWIALAGAALGLTAWVRAIGAPMVPFLALWFVLALPGRWWERLGRGALAGGVAAALVVSYSSLNLSATGHFGLTDSTGWALYGRVGQFADCTKFTPPEGTEPLCEQTPPASRPGPDFYTWESRSPAQRLFGPPTTADSQLGDFAREVILNQPLSYVYAVFNDSVEFFAPGFHDERPFAGSRYDWYDIARRDAELEPQVEAWVDEYYPGESLSVSSGGTARLSDLQQILRVHPVLILQAVALATVGLWFARGRVRAGIALMLGAGVLLLVISAAVVGYNARYAMPAGGPMVAAGALGLWVIWQRALDRRGAPARDG